MNDPAKQIKVDSSSLVSLKAELIRKQREFKEERQQAQSLQGRQVKTKIKKIKDDPGATNPGVQARASKDAEQRIEEAKQITNARDKLEKKAKIYEEMASGRIIDEEENILVDFHQKDVIRRRDEETRRDPEDKEKWESSIRLRGDRTGLGAGEEEPEGPLTVHYATVQQNEIRTHGVGYYQFSGDDEKRKEQMEQLEKLRTQTVEQKSRKDKIREKRENMMQQRLAKMRQRRGLPEPPPEETSTSKKEAPPEPEPLTRDDTWRKTASITREWDKGKKVVEDYETKRRKERNPDFAPPSLYQEDSSYNQSARPQKPYIKTTNTSNILKPQKNTKRRDVAETFNILEQLKELRSEVERKDGESTSQTSADTGVTYPMPNPVKNKSSEMEDISSIPLPEEFSHTGLNIRDKGVSIASALPVDISMETGSSQQTSPSVTSTDSSQIQQVPVPPITVPSYPPPGFSYPPLSVPFPSYPPPAFPSAPQNPAHIPEPGPSYDYTAEGYGSSDPNSATQYNYNLGQGSASMQTTGPSQTLKEVPIHRTTVPESDGSVYNDADLKESQAPQPAHYSSAPQKVQKPAPRYERVHMHTVPASLPAPPTASNIPKYKAQDGSFIPEFKGQKNNKKNVMHMWNQQYKYTGNDPTK